MYFDSANFGEDISHLKELFEQMNHQLDNVSSTISTLCSNEKSLTIEYFKTSTKTIASNQEILLNHFKNIQNYVEMVKQNYDC